MAVGAWRLALAALLLTPWALPRARQEWPSLLRSDVAKLVLSGLVLAIHFATWLMSLSYTTVASSVILVSTNPVFVALISHFVLAPRGWGERLGRVAALGIAFAVLGMAVVSYGDLSLRGRALWGDALALFGALAAAVYFLLGRALRQKLSTVAYVWPCYGLAGLTLVVLCIIGRIPLVGYPGKTYAVFALLALLPQILGHSSFNWALGHFSPTFVSLAILGEPIGATILARALLDERPEPTFFLGGPLILVGIYLASRQEMAER